jgi:hypothetical protein
MRMTSPFQHGHPRPKAREIAVVVPVVFRLER